MRGFTILISPLVALPSCVKNDNKKAPESSFRGLGKMLMMKNVKPRPPYPISNYPTIYSAHTGLFYMTFSNAVYISINRIFITPVGPFRFFAIITSANSLSASLRVSNHGRYRSMIVSAASSISTA